MEKYPLRNNVAETRGKNTKVHSANEDLSPYLFKLNLDCCDEIFALLSLQDLHSIGQTCKTMQEVAGTYFQNHYKASKIWVKHDGFRFGLETLNGFSKFIEKIWMDGGLEDFQYAGRHCNGTIKEIYFDLFSLNEAKINCIKEMLTKVEIVLLTDCIIPGDFYETFLKFCPNIRRLSVLCFEGFQHEWLFQLYPNLEYLKLAGHVTFQFDDLGRFFRNNPNVHSFAIDGCYLLSNRQLFLESELKWHDLTISLESNYAQDMNQFLIMFKDFHKQGIYQRLHLFLNGKHWDEIFFKQITAVPALVNLCLDYLSSDMCMKSSNDLRKLEIFRPLNVTTEELETLAKGFVNLERIVFREASSNEILPFIRYARKLKEVRVCWLKKGLFFDGVLNLPKLNSEREQLRSARKATIYVDEKVFLATKWAIMQSDFKSIEMRRNSSYQDPSAYATFI